MAHWYTLEEAQADWSGLGVPDAEQMQALLDVSQAECLAFSPVTTTATEPTPVTLTNGAWTVGLSGSGEMVTAEIVLAAIAAGTADTVTIPEEFRPEGTPAYVDGGGGAQGYFQAGNNTTLNLVANPPGEVVFTMYWTAADPSGQQDIPDGHRWAHLAHARNIWNAQKVNPSGGLGDDQQGFALTPFPMDWSVRARLRPRVLFGGAVG